MDADAPGLPPFAFDTTRGRVEHDGKVAWLTWTQSEIFRRMIERFPRGLMPEQIIDEVLRDTTADPGNLTRMHLSLLRKKLRPLGIAIQHRPGFGYWLNLQE